jgi:hypothetical protein
VHGKFKIADDLPVPEDYLNQAAEALPLRGLTMDSQPGHLLIFKQFDSHNATISEIEDHAQYRRFIGLFQCARKCTATTRLR